MVKRGASKRERKQRDANSCRQKARKGLKSGAVLPGAPVSACSKEDGAPETDGATGPAATMLSTAAVLPAPVLLDETLFPGLAAGDGEDGSNALIVTAGKKQKQKAAVQEPKKLSKAQQKKLKKIQEVKEQRAARSQVLASLSQHDASKDELALLRPLVKRGQKETKREGLARALRMQRAGLELPEGFMELERNVKGPSIDAPFPGAADSDSDTGSGDSMPEGRAGIGGFSGTAAGSSEDDDSEAEQEAFIDPAAVKSAIEAARLQLGLPALGTEGEERAAALKKPLKVKPAGVRNTRVVAIQRPVAVEEGRRELPIIGYEQEVMEAVGSSDVVMLSGETGCGKTTQVPQFLLEAGFGCPDFPESAGLIGVTQPRRVAAISTATRVAYELGSAIGETVGYQVRYDKSVGENTAMKFMTDGILLRELQEDFLLSKYSAIILDEAHERSLNSDLLLGMLSRVVPLRRKLAEAGERGIRPLKLVIMSATLQLDELTGNKRLFPGKVPLIHVPARCFPVTVHFARRTELDDYLGVAYKKVCRIHRELPPGAVLVFLTGQREVEHLCKQLRATFAKRPRKDETEGAKSSGKAAAVESGGPSEPVDEEKDGEDEDDGLALPERFSAADEAEDDSRRYGDESHDADADAVDDYDEMEEEEDEEEVVVLGGEGLTPAEVAEAEAAWGSTEAPRDAAGGAAPVKVLPLYGMLSKAKQDLVFGEVPDGQRLIVVATNVAETSLTIPGVRYIVDAGRSKQKILEGNSGLSRFEVRWVSKASAQQRAGRAGRVGPGHCYRLFSSAHFNDTFPDHTPPEIVNTPLEGVVLVMKSMGVDRVRNFPFPTAPEGEAIAAAELCLRSIMALDEAGQLTPTGRAMASLPIPPRHARMLLEVASDERAAQRLNRFGKRVADDSEAAPEDAARPLSYAVALTAAVSVEQPFVHAGSIAENGEAAGSRQRVREAHKVLRGSSRSDALSAMAALLAFEEADRSPAFAAASGLHFRHLQEAAALRRQLAHYLSRSRPEWRLAELLPPVQPPHPSNLIVDMLRRGAAAGWADQVAKRVKRWEAVQATTQAGGRNRAVRYMSARGEEEVFLHPNSALHASCPDYVVYKELVRTAKRPYMAVVTEVDGGWLAEASPFLCRLSEPLQEPPPVYRPERDAVLAWHSPSYGRHGWDLPLHLAPYPHRRLATATFAAALLAGEVLPSMAALTPELAAPPKWAARPENQAQKRVGQLVGALEAAGVQSRSALAAVWAAKPGFLRSELQDWLRKGRAPALDQLWPALLAEAAIPEAKLARARKKARKQRQAPAGRH
eukprot:jgi/Tetstr1/442816/TSEL_030900.t1